MERIILASSSPRRKELMDRLGIPYEIIPTSFEEDMTQPLSAEQLAITLAYGKAHDVAKRPKNGIVIGADTFIAYQRHKIGKPKSGAEAKEMLRTFSGNHHEVYTGLAIIDAQTGRGLRTFDVTSVIFKQLSDAQIEAYIATGEPLDKAGAYAIQGKGSALIERIDGEYTTVIGLPLPTLVQSLALFSVQVTAEYRLLHP